MAAGISLATAAIVGSVAVAGATIYAANQASSATESSTNAAINSQQTAQQKQQALNQPYANIGTGTPGTPSHFVKGTPGYYQNGKFIPGSVGYTEQGTPGTTGAIQQYQALLGLGPQGAAGIQSTLANTPGYQFAKQQGLESTTNQAAAMGLGLSGNTLEALDKFGTGLADSTYQEAVGNAQNAVTIGQNAAAGTGAGILQTGNNIANAQINQGNTLAGINANEAAGLTKAISGGINSAITSNTLAGLSGGGGGVSSPASYDPMTGIGAPINPMLST